MATVLVVADDAMGVGSVTGHHRRLRPRHPPNLDWRRVVVIAAMGHGMRVLAAIMRRFVRVGMGFLLQVRDIDARRVPASAGISRRTPVLWRCRIPGHHGLVKVSRLPQPLREHARALQRQRHCDRQGKPVWDGQLHRGGRKPYLEETRSYTDEAR